LGAHLAQGNVVSDHMIIAASEALAGLIEPEELAQGRVYPNMRSIRAISLRVAVEVIKAAAEEGRLANQAALRALGFGEAALEDFVRGQMYVPEYSSLVAPGPVLNHPHHGA
jgi:malic enzyme